MKSRLFAPAAILSSIAFIAMPDPASAQGHSFKEGQRIQWKDRISGQWQDGTFLYATPGGKQPVIQQQPDDVGSQTAYDWDGIREPMAGATPIAASVASPMAHLPMMFERNDGQFSTGIDFVARGPGYLMAVKPGELLMSLRNGKKESTVVRSRLAGTNDGIKATGESKMECRMSYFVGDDPSKWRTEVPTFAKVRYAGVYPGVDLVYYGNQREIEYDFIVAPGADPGQVALEFQDSVRLEESTGELVVTTGSGELRHRAPVAWQMRGNEREPVACRYVRTGAATVGFTVERYDVSRPLIIDPVISYSTYLGSTDYEESLASVVDSAGNTYVTGQTDGAGRFSPLSSANLDRDYNGGTYDAFVLKLNPDGTTIMQGSLIGGDGTDRGLAIAVDAGGNVFVAGDTDSVQKNVTSLHPPLLLLDQSVTTRHGYDEEANGGYDGFVVRFNSTFSSAPYVTFLGGPNYDSATGIAIAPDGHVWVCGLTGGDWNFTGAPAATGDMTFNGSGTDAFLLKLDPLIGNDGTGLDYFTYLGGNGNDEASGLAVDSTGHVWVTGYTFSSNFPLANPFQNLLNGLPAGSPSNWSDAFLTRFSPAGAIERSSFHGGSKNDSGKQLTVDANGRVYLLGETGSANFPVRNAAQTVHGTNPFLDELEPDMFVTRLNPDGTDREYSTLLGGDGDEVANALVVDSEFNVYIAGESASPDFPLAHAWDDTLGGAWDGVFVKLSPDGDRFMVSTFIGGSGFDGLTGVGRNEAGHIHLCGTTLSSDLAVTPGAFQSSRAGTAADMFFQRIGLDSHAPAVTITSPLGASPRALLSPFTGTVDDNELAGVSVRVQIVELNPVVRFWNGAAWITVPAGQQEPWISAVRSGLGWSVNPALIPGRAQTSPGTYTLRVQAEDSDGNLSSPDEVNVVRSDVDTTPPVITFTRPAAEGEIITGASPALTFNVTDAETGVGVILVTLRKTENGQNAYWNGTGWQSGVTTQVADRNGDSFSLPSPPSGSQRPNAQYLLVVSTSNLEVPELGSTASIGFSVDFHPSYTWTGLSSPPNNSWLDPANWSSIDAPGSFPGDGAVVVINSGSPAIAGGEDVYLQELRVGGGGSLTVFGTLAVAKKLEVLGGALHGPVTLHGGTESTWTAGTITGAFTVGENALLTVSGNGAHKDLGAAGLPGTLTNRGTVRWVEGSAQIRGYGDTGPATINNEATGVFDIAGSGYPLYHINSGNLVFNNRGRIVKSAGAGVTSLDYSHLWTFNLESGSVLENAVADPASVILRAGGNAVTNVKSGAIFRGPGRIQFAGGTPLNAEAGAWTIDNAATLELSGMVLACPQTGDLTLEPSVDSALLWAAGTIHGNLRIPAGVTLTVTGLGAHKDLGAAGKPGTIHNAGILLWTGNSSAVSIRGYGGDGPATINNLPHARFHIAGDGYPLYHINGTNCIFNNDGRIIKTAGAGTTTFDYGNLWVLNNSTGAFIENAVPGSVIERSGPSAVTNIADGPVFYGPGTIRFSDGAPLNAVAGTWNVSGNATLLFDGMTLRCPQTGSLTLQPSTGSTLRWTAGTIHGHLVIPAAATLEVTGAGAHKDLGAAGLPGTLTNHGTVRWTEGSAQLRGYGDTGAATINNEATGVFDIAGSGYPLYHINSTNLAFNNRGRIVKSAGAGTTSLDFSHLWTFNLESGSVLENAVADPASVLLRAGGGAVTNVKAGAIFRGPGRIQFAGGTPLNTEAGDWILQGAPLELAGMVLNCPQNGSLKFQPTDSAPITWTAGTIHGNLEILPNVTLQITGAGAHKDLGAAGLPGTLTNRGTVRWVEGSAQIRGFGDTGAATINNETTGVFDIAGSGYPLYHINSGNLVFNNRGHIVKSAGVGATSLDFSHLWTFNLESGSVLENAVADPASVLLRAGGGAVTNVKAGAIFRGPGRIQFADGTPLNATETGAWIIDNAATLELAGMVLACPTGAGLTLQTTGGAAATWTSGTIYGVLNIPTGTALTVTGVGAHKDLGTAGKPGTLNNAGTLTWINAVAIRGWGDTGPATLHNLPGGVLNLSGGGTAFYHQADTNNTLLNAGAMHIGSSPGAVDGTWNFTQTATGTLHLEVAGPAAAQYDRLAFSGTATLGGTVSVTKLGGYAPAEGTTFPFLTAGSVGGTFTSIAGGFGADYTGTTATLRVLAPTAFDNWAATYGLTGANALPGADSDGDGVPLFMEYALGMDPTLRSTAGVPGPALTPEGHLALSFTRREPSDVTYIVENPFAAAPGNIVAQLLPGAASWTGSATVTETGSGATRTVTVTDAASIGSTAKRFLRLRVVGPQ